MGMHDMAARTIEFWRAVELFSPQGIPDSRPADQVVDLQWDQPLPWEPRSYLARLPLRKGYEWRHVVYGGLFEVARVHQTLVDVFGEGPDAAAEHPARGVSSVFCCTVDAQGLLVQGSAVLSTCAWAVGRARKPGPKSAAWLEGFVEDALAYANTLGESAGSPVAIGAKLLSDSLRSTVPGAVGDAAKVAVTGALGGVPGPVTAMAADLAGGLAAALAKAAAGANPNSAGGQAASGSGARLDLSPLTADVLQKFTKRLVAALGIEDDLRPAGVRVKSYRVVVADPEKDGDGNSDHDGTDSNEQDESAFLNSLYASDLSRIAAVASKEGLGSAVADYLRPAATIDKRQRVDVRHRGNAAQVLALLDPERAPAGRWVSAVDQPLVFSQQFAVNQIMNTLGHDPGIFAVNGPPGTGKTTMLRDLVAAIVVGRARRLAGLKRPQDAFDPGGVTFWSIEGRKYPHRITPPREAVTGFEMVVASANNGAVENVTVEIPGPGALGKGWARHAEELDYFSAAARSVFGDGAWAMIAARLGNRSNRGTFVQKFWWGAAPKEPHDRDKDKAGRQGGSAQWPGVTAPLAGHHEQGPEVLGMSELLGRLIDAPPVNWLAEVAAFEKAAAAVDSLTAERQGVVGRIARTNAVDERARLAREALASASSHRDQAAASLAWAQQNLDQHQQTWKEAQNAHQFHRELKPGFRTSLLSLGRARSDWDQQNMALYSAVLATGEAAAAALATQREAKQRHSDAERAQRKAAKKQQEAAKAAEAQRGWLKTLPARWGGHVPVGARYEDPEQRELSSPWADEAFAAARTELFLAALRLHKAFITAQALTIRRNLSALMDVLRGQDGRPSDDALQDAWRTLFLVVPVVSTTFASFDKLFAGFGQESLGWVFIDEAGQAAPQQAVGTLWRAQRAVIVGDPLQVEPVVTLPLAGQQALARQFGVDDAWLPGLTSVQRVADQIARHGAELPAPDGDGRVWVGAPLRVHRRCDRPMFEVCNRIAYNDLMVYGTPESADPETPVEMLPANAWYDVRGQATNDKWVAAEGAVLHGLLTALRGRGIEADRIRVISPFKIVAAEARKAYAAVFPEVKSDKEREKRVGTVHTMQGRAADIVVLILGTGPERAGSRDWAARTPNLLNVAVSRARRRLYVIGNHQKWRTHRYFDVLADTLPPQEPPKSITGPR